MSKTVLVVDDIAFVRSTISQVLTQAGYRVVGEISNGEDAVEQFEKLRPDVVTMDIVMPGMSGIEATRQIVKIAPDANVIILSAMGQESLVMEAINAGARDYVTKPFKGPDLVKTLDRITGGASEKPRRTV